MAEALRANIDRKSAICMRVGLCVLNFHAEVERDVARVSHYYSLHSIGSLPNVHQTVSYSNTTPSSYVPFIPPYSFHRYRYLSVWPTVIHSLITSPPASLGSLLSSYNASLSTLLDPSPYDLCCVGGTLSLTHSLVYSGFIFIGPHCHVPSSLSHHPLHSPVIPPSLICLILLPPLYITHFPALSDCLSSIFLSDALFTSISYHRCSSTSSAPVQSLSSCLPSSLWWHRT